MNESAVTFAMFNAYIIGFAAGVHLKYSENSQCLPFFKFLSNLHLALVMVALLVVLVLLQLLKQNSFGEFKKKFKRSCMTQFYIPLSIILRVFLGFYIAFEN